MSNLETVEVSEIPLGHRVIFEASVWVVSASPLDGARRLYPCFPAYPHRESGTMYRLVRESQEVGIMPQPSTLESTELARDKAYQAEKKM